MLRIGTCLAGVLLLAAGCAGSGGGDKVSTILTDEARFVPGPVAGPVLVYLDPNAEFAAYDRIMLDPVTVWRGRRSATDGISQIQAQTLADAAYTIFYDALARDFQMVGAAGEGTLRLQVALTMPGETDVGLDVVSTVVPQFRLIAELRALEPEPPRFASEVALESRVLDAVSGQLLAASVDRQLAERPVSAASFPTWSEVQVALSLRADEIHQRLCAARGGTCAEIDGT